MTKIKNESYHPNIISSYHQQGRPRVMLGGVKDPGWIYSVSKNEWEKFDKLASEKKNEPDYLVGKGFSVMVPKNDGFVIVQKK